MNCRYYYVRLTPKSFLTARTRLLASEKAAASAGGKTLIPRKAL